MPAIFGVCEECGMTFILTAEECAIISTMRPSIRRQNQKPKPIKTWADWVQHCGTHCPICRFPAPPIQAVQDLEKHTTYKKSKS